MRLTLEVVQDPEHSTSWVAHCLEIDVTSAARSLESAIEAVAEAMRMTLRFEAERCALSTYEALAKITARVAAQQRAHVPSQKAPREANNVAELQRSQCQSLSTEERALVKSWHQELGQIPDPSLEFEHVHNARVALLARLLHEG